MPQCSNNTCPNQQYQSDLPKLQCAACRAANYCNKVCQVADWKAHKQACKASASAPEPQSKHAGSLPKGLTLKVDSSLTKGCERGLISTLEMSILNGKEEKIGDIRAYLVPKEVGETSEYFDILDARDRELSTFAYRCATDRGFLHEDICTFNGKGRWDHADSRQIIYLDEIVIEERLRGCGIGSWAIREIKNMYAKKINMIVTRPALLTRCEPLLQQEHRTKEDEAVLNARTDRVAKFYSNLGFRRLGNTEFFGLSRNPNHPSRTFSPSDDPPYQDIPPPSSEQQNLRYLLMNYGQPHPEYQGPAVSAETRNALASNRMRYLFG